MKIDLIKGPTGYYIKVHLVKIRAASFYGAMSAATLSIYKTTRVNDIDYRNEIGNTFVNCFVVRV